MNEERVQEEIRTLIQKMLTALKETSDLKEINFGLFYQEKQVSFLNLDAFKKKLEKEKEEN